MNKIGWDSVEFNCMILHILLAECKNLQNDDSCDKNICDAKLFIDAIENNIEWNSVEFIA